MRSYRFHKCLGSFNKLTVKGCFQTALFREWLTKSLRVCNFGNTLAMTITFFSKCWKFDKDLKNWIKNSEKFFCFYDSFIWIRNGKLSQSRTGYLSSTVNVLTNTRKISNITKGEIFWISFLHRNRKYNKGGSHADVKSIWDRLRCWLSKDVLKRRFLGSRLTKSLTVCNFTNTLGMTIIFFLKMFKISCRLEKVNKKIFFILKIIAFESGSAKPHNLEQDTCHRQSMC